MNEIKQASVEQHRLHQQRRPCPGDEAYGCVDWFLYDASDELSSEAQANRAPVGTVLLVKKHARPQ